VGCLQPTSARGQFRWGREPLPSAFANAGTCIVATDAPADVIRNSLEISRVEEVGVHTTEFHPCSNIDTIELPNLCLFGKSDIELVVREPAEDGRNVEPSNLWPGAMPIDECFDLPPYNAPIYSSKLHTI
jgi:hypothetical protein